MWDLFIVSALNVDGDQASTALAAKVIKTALLGRSDAADIGIAIVPLGQLHADATAVLLGRLGAQIRLGARATAVERLADGGFLVRLGRGERSGADTEDVSDAADSEAVPADGVVLAVPPEQAARLVATAGFGEPAPWAGLGYSPIVNVHVIYDRQVTGLPFAAAVDSPVQWVFDKTRQAGLESGQYLAVSVSAADDLVDVPTAAIRELFVPALEKLFPTAANASIVDFFVTRERRATFRQGPGCGTLRPGAGTPVPGLVLAGAWTATGWPDTMEGAVRSGQNAARELISALASLSPQDVAEAGGSLGSSSLASTALDSAWSGAS